MLTMIQKIFYGSLGLRSKEVKGWDLCAREHMELWPFAVLFLVMGVASPIFTRAIDTFGSLTADKPMLFEPSQIKHTESETYSSAGTQPAAGTNITWAANKPTQEAR